ELALGVFHCGAQNFDAIGGTADIDRPPAPIASEAYDPECVKTPRGITAPGILGSMVMRRTKKRKNLSSARHHDQIRFRFHTTKPPSRHSPDRNSAAQRAPDWILANPLWLALWLGVADAIWSI